MEIINSFSFESKLVRTHRPEEVQINLMYKSILCIHDISVQGAHEGLAHKDPAHKSPAHKGAARKSPGSPVRARPKRAQGGPYGLRP